MRYLLIFVLLVLGGQAALAQDFFTDRNNTGTPVYFKKNGDTTRNFLFNAGVNVADASAVKVNFFRQKWNEKYLHYKRPFMAWDKDQQKEIPDSAVHNDFNSFGWGLSLNVKTKDGLGKVLKSGNFDPGFDGGAYIAFTKYQTWKDSVFKSASHTWIISGNLGFAKYQLYDPGAAFKDQLSSRNFTAPSFGFAYVYRPALENDNIYLGASLTYKRMNTYDDLDTYEIKNDSLFTNNGITRKVTKINEDGNVYGVGDYKEYSNFRFRFNLSYVPSVFDYRFGFNIYPSVDVGGPYAARLNTGIGFSYLKDKNPSLAVFSLNFELNDINNAEKSSKTFLKHSFKIGISTNLNFITGS